MTHDYSLLHRMPAHADSHAFYNPRFISGKSSLITVFQAVRILHLDIQKQDIYLPIVF